MDYELCQILVFLAFLNFFVMGSSVNKWAKHFHGIPDSKVHGANIGLTWVLSAPGVPHVWPNELCSQGCYQHRTVLCATNGSHSPATNANLRWSTVSSYSCFSNILDLDFHIVEILKHTNCHLLCSLKLRYLIMFHTYLLLQVHTNTPPPPPHTHTRLPHWNVLWISVILKQRFMLDWRSDTTANVTICFMRVEVRKFIFFVMYKWQNF